MWKSLGKTVATIIKDAPILKSESVLRQQLRTTFILKRRTEPYANKKDSLPKRLRNRHYVYDLIRDTNVDKHPDLEVVLTSYVSGLGDVGQKVSVKQNFAYNNLLLPGLAVYASPDNLEKYKNCKTDTAEVHHSSATAQRAVSCLSKLSLTVSMNKENSWTLKPWHIKTCFRKCGYHVPEETITMPAKPITGPNMDLQNKQFYVTVTVNNLETTNVRCVLHHWSTDISERLQHDHDFWKRSLDPIFPEDAQILAEIPACQLWEDKIETIE